MKLNQVLEWIGKSPVNQVIVGGTAIILLLVILVLVRRRGSRKVKVGSQAAARIQASKNDLRDVFEAYRETQPAFHSVMTQIQTSRPLDDFMANNEFAGAIAKLRLWQAVRVGARPARPTGVSPLTIQPTSPKGNPEVRAAMLTILRILYASPEIGERLAPATEAEMDKLLDSLTT
jgi:hypothetical protein